MPNPRITEIEQKLESMREGWRVASPAYKQLIEASAKILKEEMARLSAREISQDIYYNGMGDPLPWEKRLEKKEVETEKLI